MSSSKPTPAPRPLRRRALVRAFAALATVWVSPRLQAQGVAEFRLIVHPSNPIVSVPRDFVAALFLKKTTRWSDGSLVRPVDLRHDSATRRSFSANVLRRSVPSMRSYWQQRIFSGRDVPPPELESDADVVAYVLKNPGAIGYVSQTANVGPAKSLALR
ncbi:MAG: hypothetical protein QM756_17400 [Polyangiaceae bacterium]